MNYFRAKPEFIVSDYIIAGETAQPAMKYPLLSVFQIRIYHFERTCTIDGILYGILYGGILYLNQGTR